MSKSIVSSGLRSSGTVISSGMSMYVLSGGSLTSAAVNFGGELYVSNGGYALNTSLGAGGYLRVGLGGLANSAVVTSAGAKLDIEGNANNISAGSAAANVSITVKGFVGRTTLAASGGVMNVLQQGNVSAVSVFSSSLINISSGGSANYLSVGNRGSAVIHDGGKVFNTYLSSGGRLVVSEGGYAYNAVMASGATLRVARGGSARINWSVGRGEISAAYGAEIEYLYASNFRDVVYCHGGVSSSAASVYGGSIIGSMYVFSGGVAEGVSLESGGILEVWSGGSATNVSWTPGAGKLRVYEGGTISFLHSYNGVYLSRLSDADVQHSSKASQVESGAVAYVMNGGKLCDGAVAGETFVWSGGLAKNMTLQSRGVLAISDGGVGINNQVHGAELLVFSGGVAHETIISNASKGCIVVFSGGNANNTIVSGTAGSLGSCIVSSGGVANRVSVEMGKVIVHSTGVVHSAHLTNSAKALLSGGIANSTIVSSNSELYVYDRGLALDTVASYGAVHVSEGGMTRRTQINEYSTLNVWDGGEADTTAVNFGDLNVYSGGTAVNNSVNSDGALYVWDAGFAADTTLAGGELTVWAGGEAHNSIVGAGSDLYIWSGGKHSGVLNISVEAEVYAASGSVIDFTLTDRTASDGFLINDLSLINGAPEFSITVASDQADGVYKLAQGANEWLLPIAICDEWGNNFGELTVNGEALVYNDISYSLVLQAGNLTLTHQDLALKVSAVVAVPPQNLNGSREGVSWDPVAGASGYVVEYSADNFKTAASFTVSKCSVDSFELPAGSFEWRVRALESSVWANGSAITGTPNGEAQQIVSDGDGTDDLFFANSCGVWEAGFAAEHHGDGIWDGTNGKVLLLGKNKFADLFEGSADANVLLLTDDANGDALFVDDIYSALGSKARLAQIDEIRAGAGDDVIDMTTRRYEYSGASLRISGGNGDDTIWGGAASNVLFGDEGNDSLIGASGSDLIAGGGGNDTMHGGGGNDIFTFGGAWGNDTVVQLAGGSVTLWFESGSNANWNEAAMTYSDGVNSVTVTGTQNVTLKFGSIAESGIEEAFDDSVSGKIFEDKALLA